MKTSMRYLTTHYQELDNQEVMVQGWIRTNRNQKEFGLLFNECSTLANLQIVYDRSLLTLTKLQKFRVGCSLTVTGLLVLTHKPRSPFEVKQLKLF